MKFRRWIAALGLVLVTAGGVASPTTASRARSTPARAATGSTSAPKTTDQWTCWYDGAPLVKAPTPPPKKAVRVARAGQVFPAASVQVTSSGIEWLRVQLPPQNDRLWIPLVYCRRVAAENLARRDLPCGQERIGPYDGLPPDYRPGDLVALPKKYCYNDEPQRLRSEAAEALKRMLEAARKEAHLTIQVLSAYRSSQTQTYLCRQKIRSAGINQRLVARPGHSEHQLGTTVDLVADHGLHLLNEGFGATREGRWLQLNSRRFGFVQSYSRENVTRNDMSVEPWHFRYVRTENVGKFKKQG